MCPEGLGTEYGGAVRKGACVARCSYVLGVLVGEWGPTRQIYFAFFAQHERGHRRTATQHWAQPQRNVGETASLKNLIITWWGRFQRQFFFCLVIDQN